jgi:serine protease Do
MQLRPLRRPISLALLMSMLLALTTACQIGQVPGTGSSAGSAAGGTVSAAPPSASGFSDAVRQVAQRVRPAVVQVTNQQTAVNQLNRPSTVPTGVGSGVIYDDQGHILTNNHVVEGANQLLVSLPDGRSFPATLVGGDPRTDLAVIQIHATDLPVAELGDSQELQVGDWVVAIGDALALPGGPTVTAGVVGALNRTVQEPGDSPRSSGPYLFDVIQTDAPINPGNSGGPLVNLKGQVVGINTLGAGQAEPGVQAQGIGFAISISAAKPIADQLVVTGQVVHPFLGVRFVALNPAIGAQLGVNVKEGAAIVGVVPGSPAARAGLRAREVVTQVDGTSVKDDSDLARIIAAHKPGDRLTLTVLDGGQSSTATVTLGELPTA